MSEPVSALGNISWDDGIAVTREIGPMGMITLRGDLGVAAVKNAASKTTGADMPGPGQVTLNGDFGICWMSPDEVLVLCPYSETEEILAKMIKSLGKAHALAANVSDARAVFQVSGPKAREVLAKLAPVDLSPDAFTHGMFRRTRFSQVPAAFWMMDDGTFQIVCFRSAGQYVFDLLKVAAQPGSSVDIF